MRKTRCSRAMSPGGDIGNRAPSRAKNSQKAHGATDAAQYVVPGDSNCRSAPRRAGLRAGPAPEDIGYSDLIVLKGLIGVSDLNIRNSETGVSDPDVRNHPPVPGRTGAGGSSGNPLPRAKANKKYKIKGKKGLASTPRSPSTRETNRLFLRPQISKKFWGPDKDLPKYMYALHCDLRSWFDLDGYALALEVDPYGDDESIVMTVETDLSYRHIRITHHRKLLGLWRERSFAEIVRAAVHEWVHVLVEPVVAVARLAVPPIIEAEFTRTVENTVDKLTNYLYESVPEVLKRKYYAK